MHDPTRTDVLLAIWTVLALPEADDSPTLAATDTAALSELFDDLHRDLQRAEDAIDDSFDDFAIA